jgi:hypothetical protein
MRKLIQTLLISVLLSGFVSSVWAGGGPDGVFVDKRAGADFRVDLNNNGRTNSARVKYVLPNAFLTTDPRCPAGTNTILETDPWNGYPASAYVLDCSLWKQTGNGFRYRAPRNSVGGVKSVRLRNTRKGISVDIRAQGANYYSGVGLYTYSIQVNLAVGRQNLCARFPNSDNRSERRSITNVDFKGSTVCIEKPNISVGNIRDYPQVVVGGETISVQKLVLIGDAEQDTFFHYSELAFNPEAIGKISNLTLLQDSTILDRRALPAEYNFVAPTVRPIVPAQHSLHLDFQVDTAPAHQPYFIQARTTRMNTGMCNEQLWCDNGPEYSDLPGTHIEVVPNGMLHAVLDKNGDAYSLNFISEFEGFQILSATVRGNGACAGTRVVIQIDGHYSSQPFEAVDNASLHIGNVFVEPGELTPVATFVPEPDCRLEFVGAPAIGQTSATFRHAVECTGSEAECFESPQFERLNKECLLGNCWICPVWMGPEIRFGDFNYCVMAPDSGLTWYN